MKMGRSGRPDLSAAAGWALALTLVGYPVAGLIGSALHWDSTLASVSFRLGVATLSAVLIAHSPPTREWLRKSPGLSLARGHLRGIRMVLVPAAVVVALTTLTLSASRAPLLALAVCGLGYVLSAGRRRTKLLLTAAGLLIGAVVLASMGDESQLLLRFADREEDESFQQRLVLQSMRLPSSSPVLCSAAHSGNWSFWTTHTTFSLKPPWRWE